jgi:quercetin dioxygenase-like cupin family protein
MAEGFAIFRSRQAPLLQDTAMMTAEGDAPAYGDRQHGAVVSVLFRRSGDGACSLLHVWLKPDFVVTRHSHDQDCLYYVVSGEAVLGRQVLGPGDGFFVAAGHPYAYTAGPDGAEVLEFRSADAFNIVSLEKPDAWPRILASATAHRDAWVALTVPPSWQRSAAAPDDR